jgi:Sec-independent protein translocase protein TatA
MGGQELLIVVAVLLVLLVTVPARLPKLARNVADGIREFRRIGKDHHAGDAQ